MPTANNSDRMSDAATDQARNMAEFMAFRSDLAACEALVQMDDHAMRAEVVGGYEEGLRE